MAQFAARTTPTQQEMQAALSRWQDVLMHISSAWGEPGVPTWDGPVVMARYRMDALAAALEIAALLERLGHNGGGRPVRARHHAPGLRVGSPDLH